MNDRINVVEVLDVDGNVVPEKDHKWFYFGALTYIEELERSLVTAFQALDGNIVCEARLDSARQYLPPSPQSA